MMALDPNGELVVAERGAGRIVRLPDRDDDGLADGVEVVADGLRVPSSIRYYAGSGPLAGSLYVGETTRVLRLSQPGANGVFQERDVIIEGLPSGGHNTRTVLFSPDGAFLYVSVGSSCNVCVETDPRRAAIVRYRPDGRKGRSRGYGHPFKHGVLAYYRHEEIRESSGIRSGRRLPDIPTGQGVKHDHNQT